MKYLLLVFFVCAFSLHAEEEIVVCLEGETALIPLYLAPAEPNSKLDALREVLAFDLDHNGATHVLTSKEIAATASLKGQAAYDAPIDFRKIKDEGILYLVKLRLKDKELSCKVISCNAETSQTIDNLSLTFDLSQDRKKIHKLADAIHKLLFGKEGIASSRILFAVKKRVDGKAPTWVSEIFEADYDGKNTRQITREGTYCAHPLYVPAADGNKSNSFVYVSYKIGQPKLYMGSLSDSRTGRVSRLRGNQLTPSLSKDRSRLAFACDTMGKSDLFIQALSYDDTPRQIFTAKGAANASPSFSPNGRQIAFVSNKDGSPKIYVMDIPLPGTKLQDVRCSLISKRCRENSAVTWSPDGKKLAYCANSGGPRQIWIYDFETKTERQLTKGSLTKENPAWAADSLHLIYNGTDSRGTELYLINLNQKEAVKITSGSGAKLFACWEPKLL